MAPRGPLAGVRVIELAGLGPAQLGAGLLADVIKLDRPAEVPAQPPEGVSPALLSRGRRSVAIDLKAEAGRELALALIDRADVLIEPYRPGVTERLGLGPEVVCERNPRLIYTRMTAWGQGGPMAQAAAHDLNVVALSGALHLLGERDGVPAIPLNLVADFGGGAMVLAFGVAVALYERERSGRGQVLDVSMIDGVASLMTSMFQLLYGKRFDGDRFTHWLQGAAPWYRAYRTADDRFVSVGALEPKFHAALMATLGLELGDFPQWETERWEEQSKRMAEVFATRTLEQWVDAFAGVDACFAPALTLEEVADDPHLAGRETYVRLDGQVQPAPVPRFSRTPGEIAGPAPWTGQHTREVLGELGVDAAAIDGLARDGVVG